MIADAGTEPAEATHAAGCKDPAGPDPALHVNELYVSWIQNGQPASAPLA